MNEDYYTVCDVCKIRRDTRVAPTCPVCREIKNQQDLDAFRKMKYGSRSRKNGTLFSDRET